MIDEERELERRLRAAIGAMDAPERRLRGARARSALRPLAVAVTALALLVVALGAGQLLSGLRAAAPAVGSSPDPRLEALPVKVARDDALAYVRAGTPPHDQIGRIDRIDAKLVTYADVLRAAGPQHSLPGDPRATPMGTYEHLGYIGDPTTYYLWAVAVSGEVYPAGRTPVFFGAAPVASPTPYPPYSWGLFLIDAVRGGGGVAYAGVGASWPPFFDVLPSHPATSYVAPSASFLPVLPVKVHGAVATTDVLRLVTEVRRIDRIEEKLATWAEFAALGEPRATKPTTEPADRPIWFIAVSGEIVPPFGKYGVPPRTYRWAIYFVDAMDESAGIRGMIADDDASWPAFFDRLPAHASPFDATPAPTAPPAATRLGTHLGPLAIGMSADAVLRALGEPRTRAIAHGLGTPEWLYDDVTVDLTGSVPGTVWRIIARDGSRWKTDKGVAIGSSADAARGAYASFSLTSSPSDVMVNERVAPPLQRTTLDLVVDAQGAVVAITLAEVYPVGACARAGLTPDQVASGYFEVLNAGRVSELWRCWGDDVTDRVAIASRYADTGGTSRLEIGATTLRADGSAAVEVRAWWRAMDVWAAWGSGDTKWLILRTQADGRWAIESVATAIVAR